jgi:polyhydroxyalkanoate synthesis regulator phasin
LLLILSIIVSTVAALEPQEIGRGRSGAVVNLDAGPNNSGIKLHFGTEGFAAPSIPQFAEVSPGAMVHQSKMYRDESRRLYSNACSILNQTSDLENSTRQSTERATASSAMAEVSANSSMSNAEQCKIYLSQTGSALSKTIATSNRTEMLAKVLTEMENVTREYAQDAVRSSQVARDHLNDTVSERNNLSVLMQRVDILEKKVAELEAPTH